MQQLRSHDVTAGDILPKVTDGSIISRRIQFSRKDVHAIGYPMPDARRPQKLS
jgi:hypothetical protein